MNKAGIELLKEFEGWRGKAYRDIVGVLTIGYGFTEGVRPGQIMNRAQGEARLKKEVAKYEEAVLASCTVEPNENELAAMTCLAYNIGIAGFKRSTVLKAHNRGDKQSASRAFGLWNRAGGREVAGLTRRRAAEAELYLRPAGDDPRDMPQRVDPEKPMAKSPINLLGGGVGATGALGFVGEAAEGTTVGSVVEQVREYGGEAATFLGMTPLQAFCLLLVLAAIGIMVFRWLQRDRGWT